MDQGTFSGFIHWNPQAQGATQYIVSMSSLKQIPCFMDMFSVSNACSTYRVSNHTYFVNKGMYFDIS